MREDGKVRKKGGAGVWVGRKTERGGGGGEGSRAPNIREYYETRIKIKIRYHLILT